MDDKWRKLTCYICGGRGYYRSYESFEDCDCESGYFWIRPKGHMFAYPGGPALGMAGKDWYEQGTPVMPYDSHIQDIPDDRDIWEGWNGEDHVFWNYPKGEYACSCGDFFGSAKEHEKHFKQMEKEFIESHKPTAQKVPS